ncbi:MAG TPA: arabinan endo-1,5-alpha-L-arabinosidase [Flavisolibacter sp.]|nr:arabinan endo-1,5-alpha-L-arabinosidase [Flavisolibacter sp.]
MYGKKVILAALIVLTFNVQSFAQDTLNPLKGDIRAHDPVMIKEGKIYYVFTTGRGVGSKISEDKVNWKRGPNVFPQGTLPAWHKNDIPAQDGHLWAPDIHYRNGKYYLYYSVSAWMNFNSSVGLATNKTLDSTSADYKWVDEGQIISYKNGGEGVNVIDPNVFSDSDGKFWLLYGSYKAGLRMVELNPTTGKLLNPESPVLITLTKALGEGVFLIKGHGYYYIFASRGRCCAGLESTYQIVMGRSKDIRGPYLNKEGKSWVENNYSLFLAGDSTEPGRGHNGFFTEGDSTFIVYHAYTRAAKGTSLLNIKPLYIDNEGWPSFKPTGKLFRREN